MVASVVQKKVRQMNARAFFNAAILAVLVGIGTSGAAWANILIVIDKSSQHMSVTVDGANRYNWPVSTGRPGYSTPSGTFTPFRMEADHFSKEWDDAPMPYSIFFTRQGHAIHGSYHSGLGAPRSHGCVRISPSNAAILYSLVQAEGLGRTKVVLTGAEPSGGFGFGLFGFRQN
jgi:lipoprotein-anchoring transpeptidase ErfK/SrfK